MAREFFCAYHSLSDTTRCLNDAEFGRLMRAAISYSASGETPTLSGREAVLWDMVRWQIDRDIEKYDAFADKQAENGKKGGRPKKPTETQKTQAFSGKPKKANTKEKENDIEPTALTPLTHLVGAMAEFRAHRKTLRKPLSAKAEELIIKELERLAPSDEKKQIAIIEQSIANGWQGVFELKSDTRKPRRTGANANYAQREYSDRDLDGVLLDFGREG